MRVAAFQEEIALREPEAKPPDGTAQISTATMVEEAGIETEPYIVCRQCQHPVTRRQEAIAMEGSHTHTFANPHGVVFEIGCFREANGCRQIGPSTDEFTWFRGYEWRIAICHGCAVHLGWRFTSPGRAAFHALILDRLIIPDG
jgi:hypothetical protein